jgi:hypothetical protein
MIVAKPGKPVRFAVIDATDGRRSMTWEVVTAKNTLDVYVMARSMGHVWKYSLHESDDWYTGFTESGAQRFVPDALSRHIDKWRRPEAFAPGFHRGLQIVAPDAELRAWPSDVTESKSDKVVAVPAPGPGNVAVIELLFAPIGDWEPIQLDIDAAFHVGTLERADKSTVYVVALQRPWLEADHPRVESQKGDVLAKVPGDWWQSVRAPRCCALGVHDDGMRYVIDLAADPSSPD